jgi:hypothetical protein
MPESANPAYRRLGGHRWLRWQSDDGWLAADHLLFVRTRFFSEQYTRLYWNDVQALLLYRFAQSTGLMLAAEVVCVMAAVTVAIVQNRFETIALAFCYVVLYAAWRLTRRNFGVGIFTRTANVRIPVSIFRRSARHLAGQLQQAVEGAQGRLVPPEVVVLGGSVAAEHAISGPSAVTVKPSGSKRRPVLIVHGIVFGLGLTTWLFVSGAVPSAPYWIAIGTLLSILFYAGLIAAFFLQQDPEFPFAVRAAAVMNLALQVAVLGPVLAMGARLSFPAVNTAIVVLSPPMTLLRLLGCLFGLMGIYKNSLDESDKPLAQPGTGSNSLA